MGRMRMRQVTAGLVAAGALLGLAPAGLGGEKVAVEAAVDWASHYVWRGMVLTDGPVVQPSVTVSAGGLSLNVWGSIDATEVNEDNGEDGRLQEVDYILSYAVSPFEGLDLEAGFMWYTFSSYESTGELYGTATLPCVLLSPSLSAYYDVDEADGWYLNAGLEHSFALTEKLALVLAGGLGWGSGNFHEYYYGTASHGSESDLLTKATLEYAMTDYLTLSVFGAYSKLLDGDVQRDAKDTYGDADVLFGGVGVAVEF